MFKIRPYRNSDFEMISQWWNAVNEIGPTRDMMPVESSFVLEIGRTPALAVTLYLTNSKAVAYVENFIGNPTLAGPLRREASQYLNSHLVSFARERGYRNLLCMAHKDQLRKRYAELGYTETLSNVSTFVLRTGE